MDDIGNESANQFSRRVFAQRSQSDLDVSRSTVRKVVRSGAPSFSYERKTPPRPNIEPRQSELGGILVENAFDAGVPARFILSTA